MINFNNSYGSVFKVEDKGNYVKADFSTSRKDQNGEYVNSYWKAIFLGNAKEAAKSLTDRDRIHVTSGGVANEPYTNANGERRSFPSVKIFEFEKLGSGNGAAKEDKKSTKKTTKKSTKKAEVEVDDDDEVPF